MRAYITMAALALGLALYGCGGGGGKATSNGQPATGASQSETGGQQDEGAGMGGGRMGGGMMGGGMMGGGGSGQAQPEQQPAGQTPALSGKVEDGVRVVEMTAFRYSYDPDTVVVKEGEPVKLVITSKDVEHGFAIDAFRVSTMLPPQKAVSVEFTPNKTGEFTFHCTVYCGPGHADMTGKLTVVK